MVRLFPVKRTHYRQSLGRMGEQRGVHFLCRQGYRILATNYRTRCGEIDIIARDRDENVVFVEVKTRRTVRFGHAVESVTKIKQKRILQSALFFLKERHLTGCGIRMVVLGIEGDTVDLYENGFLPRGKYTL